MTPRYTRSLLPSLLVLGLLGRPALAGAAECYEGITVAEGCLGLTYDGCCDESGAALWCETPDGPTCRNPCAGGSGSCGWTGSYYYCGGEGADPTGTLPMACAACDPTCGAEAQCVGGTCVPCTCGDKACGVGTCGQSCGECGADAECTDGACVAIPTCVDVALVTCDQVVTGDLAAGTGIIDVWGANGAYGLETAYRFVAASDDEVSIGLESPAALVVAVTEGVCRPEATLAAGGADTFWLTSWVAVTAGTTYFVVVDGPVDAAGSYTFALRCQSTCTPKCDGRVCGDDGCGGSCGACAGVCAKGVCYEDDGCSPDHLTGAAGCPDCACEACVCAVDVYCCEGEWDGTCQGECLTVCAGCGALEACGDGTCAGAETCANCAADCACLAGLACSAAGLCYTPDCLGRECGDDGEGGSCGDCINDCTGQVDPSFCDVEPGICLHACCPDCTGKECGDDGCGSVCGTCNDGETCEGGQCVPGDVEAPDDACDEHGSGEEADASPIPDTVERDDADVARPEPVGDDAEVAKTEVAKTEVVETADVADPGPDTASGGGGGCTFGAAGTASPLALLLALGALVLVTRRGGARTTPGARRPD